MDITSESGEINELCEKINTLIEIANDKYEATFSLEWRKHLDDEWIRNLKCKSFKPWSDKKNDERDFSLPKHLRRNLIFDHGCTLSIAIQISSKVPIWNVNSESTFSKRLKAIPGEYFSLDVDENLEIKYLVPNIENANILEYFYGGSGYDSQ
jgi:hypothetical protein